MNRVGRITSIAKKHNTSISTVRKANAMKKGRPENKEQLKKVLRSYLKKTQKTPQKIMNFFLKKEVRYITAVKT